LLAKELIKLEKQMPNFGNIPQNSLFHHINFFLKKIISQKVGFLFLEFFFFDNLDHTLQHFFFDNLDPTLQHISSAPKCLSVSIEVFVPYLMTHFPFDQIEGCFEI
jgi:hypothetical protein